VGENALVSSFVYPLESATMIMSLVIKGKSKVSVVNVQLSPSSQSTFHEIVEGDRECGHDTSLYSQKTKKFLGKRALFV